MSSHFLIACCSTAGGVGNTSRGSSLAAPSLVLPPPFALKNNQKRCDPQCTHLLAEVIKCRFLAGLQDVILRFRPNPEVILETAEMRVRRKLVRKWMAGGRE